MKKKKVRQKQVKVYFCPRCKSFDVGFVFGMKNLIGIIPKMECKKCGASGGIFPMMVISKARLEKLNNKSETKKSKGGKKK